MPLYLPEHLTATPAVQGNTLTWQNISAAATSITVLRGPGNQTPDTVLATLGPEATSYDLSTNYRVPTYTYSPANPADFAPPPVPGGENLRPGFAHQQ